MLDRQIEQSLDAADEGVYVLALYEDDAVPVFPGVGDIPQGAGFDPGPISSPVSSGGGFGLFSLRERLAMMGGRMEIEAAPGRGATFHLVVTSG